MKDKLSQIEINNPYGRKWRQTKEHFDESQRGVWKVGLKLSIQKTKIMVSGPITSWQRDGDTMETEILFFWTPKSLQSPSAVILGLKDAWSWEEKLWPN